MIHHGEKIRDSECINPDSGEIEGLDVERKLWGEYPVDNVLIRSETRTVWEVMQRIDSNLVIMDPDFQQEPIWPEDKQSKLIESIAMRIPLPVFYLSEDNEGRGIIVDGLQRLSTLARFLKDQLRLDIPSREELDGKRFSELSSKLQNRVEDCVLIFYVIDSKMPAYAKLDIFERVNSGVSITRQQMRNSLYMGPATRFLKEESRTDIFRIATGNSLNVRTMRDREFVNRFCAFQIQDIDQYHSDMDAFLASCLREMNNPTRIDLARLSEDFRRGLQNNLMLFGCHAFRTSIGKERRSVINASLWDVMSTGLSRHPTRRVAIHADSLVSQVSELIDTEKFNSAIKFGTNDINKVRIRFEMMHNIFKRVLGINTYY